MQWGTPGYTITLRPTGPCYASKSYVRKCGLPNDPTELPDHGALVRRTMRFNWELTKGGKTVALDLIFQVMSSDPFMHRQLVLDGVGISILPLWMAKDPAIAADLERVLPSWVPDPVSLCALYSGTSDMIPKIKIFLDFMAAHLGTDLDPRLHGLKAMECFAATAGERLQPAQKKVGAPGFVAPFKKGQSSIAYKAS